MYAKSFATIIQLCLKAAAAYILIYSLAYAVDIIPQAQAQSDNSNRRNQRNIEKHLEKRAERNVEKNLNKNIEKHIEKRAEMAIEKALDKTLKSQMEKNNRGMGSIMSDPSARQEIFDASQHSPGKIISASARAKNTASAKSEKVAVPAHSLSLGDDGFYRLQNQWLLLTDQKTLAKLRHQGFDIINTTELSAFNKILVEIKEPANKTLDQVSNANYQLLSNAVIDYNHLFQYQGRSIKVFDKNKSSTRQPGNVLAINDNRHNSNKVKIGLIDSQINATHIVFKQASLQQKSFVEKGLIEPSEHGTAIASVLVGSSDHYQGLLPNAKLYAASVFYNTPTIKQGASVKSLLFALDWLASQKVSTINMSLAGPENALLKYAIDSVIAQGISVIAAVGNNGPKAAPLYPAAYKNVIAVTAVNREMQAYFKSNRGPHIDFSAPGVNILHASDNNQFESSSGTSFAAPFVSALAAYIHSAFPKKNIYATILDNVLDIGKKGNDDIYGHGLVQKPR